MTPGGVRAASWRVAWGVADQVVWSLGNVLVALLVVRVAAPDQFGAFTLALALYIMVLGIGRSFGSEPLLVRFSQSSPLQLTAAARQCAGLSLLLGLWAGGAAIAAGILIPSPLGSALRSLGIVLPGLCLQDSLRFVLIAKGRTPRAVVNDLIWVGLQVAALVYVSRHGQPSTARIVLSWGLSGSLAAALALWQAGLLPQLRQSRAWLSYHWDLGSRFAGEFAAIQGSLQLTMYTVGLAAGLAELGALRAAHIAFGPVGMVVAGLRMAIVPEAVRLSTQSVERLRRAAFLVSATLAAATLAVGLLAVLLPRGLGLLIFGPIWIRVVPLLLPTTAARLFDVASLGPFAGLRALGAASRSLRARCLTGVLLLLFGTGGAALAGAFGAALGLAAAYGLGLLLWWRLFLRETYGPRWSQSQQSAPSA